MAAPPPRSPVLPVSWEIVDESMSEAEFLWRRWESALVACDMNVAAVATWIEERLLGALDGLIVAGDAGIERILVPALDSDDLCRVSAAAHALFLTGHPGDTTDIFVSHFASASEQKRAAMRRAIELAARPRIDVALRELTERASDEVRAAALDAASFGGHLLPIDFRACFSGAPVLQRAAAIHLREAPPRVQDAWIDHALNRLGPAAQSAAAETALLMGHPAGLSACRELATAQIAPSDDMLLLLGIFGSDADHRHLTEALAKPGRRRAGIWALGFAGTRDAAAACIDLLGHEIDVKLAAESFCAITGLSLASEGLVAPEPPEGDEPLAFEDEDLDADLGPGPDDDLVRPDVPAVIRWWSRHQGRFESNLRYFDGRPRSFERLQQALEVGPMRRRHAIAAELAVRTAGRYRVRASDFVGRQRGQMAGFRTLPREAFAGPLARPLIRSGHRS